MLMLPGNTGLGMVPNPVLSRTYHPPEFGCYASIHHKSAGKSSLLLRQYYVGKLALGHEICLFHIGLSLSQILLLKIETAAQAGLASFSFV